MVDAQETRRILDRLYGYELSPVLWRKVRAGLSAGRVQSVATRLCVERERERMAFVAAGYADITGTFQPEGDSAFSAKLSSVEGKRVASGRDFADDGTLKSTNVAHLDVAAAEAIVAGLAQSQFAVRGVEEKPYTRRPAAPFITSTLQQEASRKLRLNARQTMRTAQGLYERGYITYMRTDSIQLSSQALAAARAQARELYGPEYVPDSPRNYTSKTKNAQEGHEAIRPAGRRSGRRRRCPVSCVGTTTASTTSSGSGPSPPRCTTPAGRPPPSASARPRPTAARSSSPPPARSSRSAGSSPPTRRAATPPATTRVRATRTAACRRSPPATR